MIGYLQIAFLAVVIIVSYTIGGKVTKGVWEPAYLHLSATLTKLQADYTLERTKASGEADVVTVYLQGKTEIREKVHDATQEQIDLAINNYISSLNDNGLLIVPKEGDTGSSGLSSSMSSAAKTSYDRGGESGLFADLDKFERATLREIIDKAMRSQTRNIEHLEHLKDQEREMQPKREAYKKAISQ